MIFLLLLTTLAQSPIVSPSVQITALICTMLSTMFGGYMTYLMWRFNQGQTALNQGQQVRADRADATASRAATKLDRSNAATSGKLQDAVDKADEVKATLEASNEVGNRKLDELAEIARTTHGLVNGNMGIQLRLNRTLSSRIADLTGEPADRDAAELADRLYAEHVSKEAANAAAAVPLDARKALP